MEGNFNPAVGGPVNFEMILNDLRQQLMEVNLLCKYYFKHSIQQQRNILCAGFLIHVQLMTSFHFPQVQSVNANLRMENNRLKAETYKQIEEQLTNTPTYYYIWISYHHKKRALLGM